MLQPPQCCGSRCVDTHRPPHDTCRGGHAGRHPPTTHAWPGAHGMLQPPQWAGLDSGSTHAPEHSSVPPRQTSAHWLLEQRRSAAHVVPHAPQLVRSVRGSTQAPLQARSGAAQRVPQRPSTHSPVAQSAVRLHVCPIAHVGHAPPPQSTSVSSPSRSWLVQDGAAGPPSTHGRHAPPQSTSVSAPFCTPSSHEGAAHRLSSHTALEQSPSTRQSPLVAQPAQTPPPQSRSVSRPLSRPSAQSAGRCVMS